MSVDSYFCFCCLTTTNLTNLFGNGTNKESDYASLLRNLCSVSICKLHYKDDSYICEECIRRLTDAQLFKLQVLNTINILQINGLIKTKKFKGELTLVMKAIKEYASSDEDVKPQPEELITDLIDERNVSNDHNNTHLTDDTDVDYKPEYLEVVKTKKFKGELTLVKKAIEEYTSSDEDVKPQAEGLITDLIDGRNVSNDHNNTHLTYDTEVDYKSEYLEEFTEDELNNSYTVKHKNEKSANKKRKLNAVKNKSNNKINRYRQYREKLPYSINEDLKCDICCSILPNLPTYHKHMNEHYASFFCDTCGKGFWSAIRLRKHTIIHATQEYTCPNCKRVFKKYHTFTGHKKLCVRKDKFRYCCRYCDERFVTFHRRMLHLEAVHGKAERQFKCVLCPMSFLVKSDLSVHIKRTHLKLKRLFCEVCNMGFYSKDNLKSHMHRHTGKKDFKCSLCPKAYTRQKALVVHMRIHTNDRRFGCDRCGKMFFQKCTLQGHMKIHEKDELGNHEL